MTATVANRQCILNNLIGEKNQISARVVKWSTDVSTKNEGAILKFYNELVPEANDIPVDMDMLVNKAFPAFENAIGKVNWKKVTKYFGIGEKSPSKSIRHDEVSILISELRTIENAQYYLVGFSDLLKKYASKVSNAPEGTTVIEKAKVARMFLILYSYFYFFAEDYLIPLGDTEPRVNYLRALEINKKNICPEEMFYIYRASAERYGEGSLMFDAIIEDVKNFDKHTKKDILDFAELSFSKNGNVVSVNKKSSFSTFGSVRKLKTRMFPKMGVIPNELYFVKEMWSQLEFGETYNVYRLLSENELNLFPKHLRKMPVIEGGKFWEKELEFYTIAPGVEFSCKTEAQRFIRLVNYLAKNNVVIQVELTLEESSDNSKILDKVEVGKFFSFLKFARKCNYLSENSTPNDEYSMYYAMLENGCDVALTAYMDGEFTADEVKEKIGIDEKFETEILGIKRPKDLVKIAKDFAIENKIVSNDEEISEELIKNVIIPQNEEKWQSYAEGKLLSKKLISEIGLDLEIAKMYFCISQIDIEVLEKKLQELKSRRAGKKEMKKNALTIILYCYVIEGQIACGPKNKVPKGNKRLKTENLRSLIS